MLNHLAKYQNNYIYTLRGIWSFSNNHLQSLLIFFIPPLFFTMPRKRNNRRIMGEEGWTYRCSICKQYQPPDNFHQDRSKPPFYLSYNCKQCRKNINQREPDPETASEKDRILQALGYDLDKDIHQQFMEYVQKRTKGL